MELEITAESSFSFGITLNGHRHFLEQRGGEWRMDGRWIASRRIEWPEALARALRVLTDSTNHRTQSAIGSHT